MNIIPEKSSTKILNYFCTWFVQGLIRGDGADITETAVQPDGTIRITHDMIEKLFYSEDQSEPAIMFAVEYGE